MSAEALPWIAACVLAISLLYSSVGQAGASGYLAVMSLFGVAPELMKPTALALNILVASIGSVQFLRAGHFSWALFWPFALLAVPLGFVGGAVALRASAFHALLGAMLLFAALRLLREPHAAETTRAPALPAALATGGAIGLLATLTGTGGGVFLTPLVISQRWATLKQTAAISALFILATSSAGLAGNLWRGGAFPKPALALLGAAALGGAAGSYLGSRRLPHRALQRVLALILLCAGAKLIWDALAS